MQTKLGEIVLIRPVYIYIHIHIFLLSHHTRSVRLALAVKFYSYIRFFPDKNENRLMKGNGERERERDPPKKKY
jgi:hypothetical protein